jgi:hypothetical protein
MLIHFQRIKNQLQDKRPKLRGMRMNLLGICGRTTVHDNFSKVMGYEDYLRYWI